MLRLRSEQAEQIGWTHFVARAIEHMRTRYPDFAALEPAITHPFVENTLQDATALHGLDEQRAAMTFLLVAWFLGPDFAEVHPAARDILQDRATSVRERGSRLYRWAWKKLGEEPR